MTFLCHIKSIVFISYSNVWKIEKKRLMFSFVLMLELTFDDLWQLENKCCQLLPMHHSPRRQTAEPQMARHGMYCDNSSTNVEPCNIKTRKCAKKNILFRRKIAILEQFLRQLFHTLLYGKRVVRWTSVREWLPIISMVKSS